jgi:hypothetical protein
MFSNLNKVIDDYGKQTVKLARRNLNLTGFAGKKGRKSNSSGDLSKGLGYKITDGKTGLVIEFTSKRDYGRFVEEGRKKGSMPPKAALKAWIKQKKVKLRKTTTNKAGQKISKFVRMTDANLNSAAFAMAKRIKERGIKPVPFMGDAMDEAFNKLTPLAEEALVKDLEDLLFKDFQKDPNINIT